MASEKTLTFNNIDDFLDHHLPEVKGALWIHNESHIEKSLPFHGYNYLFDGILQKRPIEQISSDSLFFTNLFGSPFFLGLTKGDSKSFDNFLIHLSKTITNKVETGSRVLILTTLGEALPINVKNKLKDYNLTHVTYTL